jgi:hypothetical protein
MAIALVCWRSMLRASWRQAVVVTLLGGVLGAVALAALAGARSTAGAYGRYLTAINASDVQVNVPGALPGLPIMEPIKRLWSLPGAVSHATYVGLNALPVVRGKVDDSFITGSVEGSVDGAGFTQDVMTVVSGKLPPLASTTDVVLSPQIATLFGVRVGGRMTYVFLSGSQQHPVRVYRSFRVAAIAYTPPALVDQADNPEGTTLPPGATAQLIGKYYGYAWVGLRLTAGDAGVSDLRRRLPALVSSLEAESDHVTHTQDAGLTFSAKRTRTVEDEVQQAIEPEVIALTVFGAITAVAALVLTGLAMAQLLSRTAPDARMLRELGASRRQAALVAALPGGIPVAGIIAITVAGAVLLSPLAPVGPVRFFAPGKGLHADPVVLGAGLPALLIVFSGLLGVLALRAVRPARPAPGTERSAVTRAAIAAGLPPAAVVGTRNALSGGATAAGGRLAGTLGGSIVAVAAIAAAVVFGASLTGLVSHPVRYGWNWDVLVQAEGSYGTFLDQDLAKDPVADLRQDAMIGLVAGQRAVAGWSEFGFGQIPVGGLPTLPVLGVERHLGTVEPPTTSGRPLSGNDEIELGAVTLRQLGKKVGDTVTVGAGRFARRVTIAGTVTLPSFGVGLADHVSLGQGAMLSEDTLLALTGAASGPASDVSQPVFPSVAVIDLRPGTTPAQRAALVHRIVSANPDGTDGGTYELPPQLASSVLNAQQLGGQPLALAAGLAGAAALSLAMTVLVDVRRRRREFAVLKALGMTRRQVWSAVAWQTTLTLLIAVLVGAPLGVAAGRAGWRGFADSLGVVPSTEIPLVTLIAGLLALVIAGNLLASVPAAIAARTHAAVFLRSD